MKKYKTLKAKHKRAQGFTIIEVSLFLALTGLVLMGVINTFSSVSRQRYNDSVQNFADYLRGLYSQTENVQNSDCSCDSSGKNCCGQSATAIYGKVIIFSGGQTATSFDVIGEAHITNEKDDAKESLGSDKGSAKIRRISGDQGQTYSTLWQVRTPIRVNNSDSGGTVLIVRSPNTGIIHTYFSKTNPTDNDLTKWLEKANSGPVNFCVRSDDLGGSLPRNIRIIEDAHSASGVELIPVDLGGSVCN